MGYSEDRESISGQPYKVHFDDDHREVGRSEQHFNIIGEEIWKHYDAEGNLIGESQDYEGFFQDYTEHRDADGNYSGETREFVSLVGVPYSEHRDADGNVVGHSHEREALVGPDYVEHEGQVPHTSDPNSDPSEAVQTSVDDGEWSLGDAIGGGLVAIPVGLVTLALSYLANSTGSIILSGLTVLGAIATIYLAWRLALILLAIYFLYLWIF